MLLNDFLFFTPTGYQSAGSKFEMGGARATQLYYNIDGISANSPAFGVQNSAVEPSVDSIAEMKFNMVENKAEYSMVTNVIAITKSGQNTFHGRLFEQNTNTALTARSFFAPTVGQNIINDFGASMGGPIKRNKMFFFGTYEGFRQRDPRGFDAERSHGPDAHRRLFPVAHRNIADHHKKSLQWSSISE